MLRRVAQLVVAVRQLDPLDIGLEALGNRFQSIQVLGVTVPTQFMQALPYILTVVILAGFVGKAIPPRAGGEPYVKER